MSVTAFNRSTSGYCTLHAPFQAIPLLIYPVFPFLGAALITSAHASLGPSPPATSSLEYKILKQSTRPAAPTVVFV